MHRRPSLIFLVAAAALVAWFLYNSASEGPATYGGGPAAPDVEEQDPGEAEQADYGSAERRARIDGALRQKAARF
jgi:hypothetical protein